MPDSFIFLFGKDRLATTLVGKGQYCHSFGGDLERKIVPAGEDYGIPVLHLVHLDLDDPAVPISIPQVRQLPLLYVFDSRTADFAYRLRPDGCVETFFRHVGPAGTYEVEGPRDSTGEFPRSDILVADCEFDPTNVDDVFTWGGIFGIGGLSEKDRKRLKRRIKHDFGAIHDFRNATDNTYVDALSFPVFTQGKPRTRCFNPHCENHDRLGKMTMIALLSPTPVPGVDLPGGAHFQVVYELCPECNTIHASNVSYVD